jgi:hypothetical protein
VFSYDPLGYAKSSYYDHPGGGFTLTTSAHRSMLHDVVSDMKTGGYRITTTGDCSGTTTPGDTKDPTVVIIGHSAYFEFFQTTQNCLDFNTYAPGAVQYVTKIACAPPFLDSPFGEILDLGVDHVVNWLTAHGLAPRSARATQPR